MFMIYCIISTIVIITLCYHNYKVSRSNVHRHSLRLKSYKTLYYVLMTTGDEKVTERVMQLSDYQLDRLNDILYHQPNISIDAAIKRATTSYY